MVDFSNYCLWSGVQQRRSCGAAPGVATAMTADATPEPHPPPLATGQKQPPAKVAIRRADADPDGSDGLSRRELAEEFRR
jgi:hypothetical protein